ncbi:hypothetical protein [Lentilactobacillus hilgardii]|nr:hypothetical protein [Lentilactobacillus hilgardii]KRK53525.1 hypothetical protein FD42_GL002081 [Lentilactobacillus hilgardii DSM 20176 = ATCC 8290]TDG86523.1 hypothetical protein C5L34_002354 [Lentilactobacillus hilgardii]
MVNGAIINGKELFANADTGWQTCNDYQGSLINTNMSLIQYRVFNDVLFITGSVSIQQGAGAASNFALKIDKSWKLPDPIDTNTWNAIQQRSIDPSGGIATVYLNYKTAYDNGYLLAFRTDNLDGFSNTEAAQAHFSFAIPIAVKTSGGGQSDRLNHWYYYVSERSVAA